MSYSNCMCISIQGAINKPPKEIRQMGFTFEDGELATVPEVRAFLKEKLEQGWLKLPMGDCDNFDKKEGCLGHSNATKMISHIIEVEYPELEFLIYTDMMKPLEAKVKIKNHNPEEIKQLLFNKMELGFYVEVVRDDYI